MKGSKDLWAVGYDNVARAHQVGKMIEELARDTNRLRLHDIAVVVRELDGSFTLDREPFPIAANLVHPSLLGLVVGAVVGAPALGAAIGAVVGVLGTAAALMEVGISDDFVRDVRTLMKPGTSALFVLVSEGDMDVTLQAIRGLGGTVLRTDVDVERLRLIQSTLSAPPQPPS